MKENVRLLFVIIILIFWGNAANGQNDEFKEIVQIPASPVKDQQKTSTCWSFATTSFIESEVLRKGKGEIDLSEMYFIRCAYLQKAERFLLFHGHINFDQGGQAHDVINAIRQFGILPESEYPGIYDHSKMIVELKKFITRTNDNFKKKKAEQWKEKYTNMLDEYFGKVPTEFGLKGQIYSPGGFVDFLRINPDDYIEFTSFTHHPFYEQINIEIPDNWSHGSYINVPVDELIEIMDSSLFKGYTVCWDGDISEKGFKYKTGKAILAEGTITDQQARQTTFLNRETTDDHLMHVVGISEDEKGQKYYYTKNSWGTEKSDYHGYLYISEPYVRLKTIAIMVNRDAVPKSIMAKIK